MQMMYETIYKALVEVGLEGAYLPQDYLNFFCLGNREAIDGHDTMIPGSPAANTPQVTLITSIIHWFWYKLLLYTGDIPNTEVDNFQIL